MHEEVITTTSASPKFSNSTIVNATSLHQSNDSGSSTITVSILHPHQHHAAELGDFIATSDLSVPCSTVTNQILPPLSKIIVTSEDLQALKDDVSSVIINGTISSCNDPNVIILPAAETCDSDKNALSLSQLTTSQADHIEIDIHDVHSPTDEASDEGESDIS